MRIFIIATYLVMSLAGKASAFTGVPDATHSGCSAAADDWWQLAFDLANALSPMDQATSCTSAPIVKESKSGCCSHHGGVCGCDSNTGHQLCCDGADSPSCGC